jgi:hypothetical protein
LTATTLIQVAERRDSLETIETPPG